MNLKLYFYKNLKVSSSKFITKLILIMFKKGLLNFIIIPVFYLFFNIISLTMA